MKEFIRTDDYLSKLFAAALDQHTILDAKIVIQYSHQHNKLKAYCPQTCTYLQFPTKLRRENAVYIADVVKAKKETGTIFYRAYHGSIRDTNGIIVG